MELKFQGICHLLAKIGTYCTANFAYELAEEEEEFNTDHEMLEMHMQMEGVQRELTDDEEMEPSMLAIYGHGFGPETPMGESSSSGFRMHSAFRYHGGAANNLNFYMYSFFVCLFGNFYFSLGRFYKISEGMYKINM